MTIVAEDDVRFLESSFTLDVHLIVPVDQDVGNRAIGEQRLERSEAEQFVENVDDQAFAFGEAERHLLLLALENGGDERAQFGLRLLARARWRAGRGSGD